MDVERPSAAALLQKAVGLHQAGQLQQARGIYERLVEQDPGHADALHLLGLIEHQSGRSAEAVRWIERALTCRPTAAVFHANLGECYRTLGQFAVATDHLQEAVRLNPGLPGAWNSWGVLCRTQGDLSRAVEFFREAIRVAPNFGDAHVNLALALRDSGRHETALRHARRGVELDPGSATGHNNLANLLSDQGETDEALAHYKKSIELDPTFGQAYSNWARSQRFTEENRNDLQQMESVLKTEAVSRESASHLHFALGKAYDDLGWWEQAFGHFNTANELADAHFDSLGFQQYVASIRSAYTPQLLQAKQPLGSSSRLPVFIVGMPRSGTSLVEQILASHPRIAGVGERKEIALLTSSLPARIPSNAAYPGCVADLDRRTVRQLAEEYLAAMRQEVRDCERVVDKMMTNYLHLGLIAILLPQATVIHVRRCPLDVCLSCYFQDFSYRPGYAYDLGQLGDYYRQYHQLMLYWRQLLPGWMVEVDYEHLVDHQEETSRRLVEACGLPWHPACLAFHQTRRVVRTASNWQVRQAMHTRSRDRWKNYEKHLGPLQAALAGIIHDVS